MDNNASKEVIHKISENLNKENTAAIVRTLLKLHKYGGTTKEKLIDTLVIDENVPVVDAKLIVQSVLMAGVEFGAIIKVPDIVYKLDDEFYSFLVDYYSQNYDKNKYCKKKSSEIVFQKYKRNPRGHRLRNSEKKLFNDPNKKRKGRRKKLPSKVVTKKPLKSCLKKEKQKKEAQQKSTGGFWSSLFGFNKVKTRKCTRGRRRLDIPRRIKHDTKRNLQLKPCMTTYSNFANFINEQKNMHNDNLLQLLQDNHLLNLSSLRSETMPELISCAGGESQSIPISLNNYVMRKPGKIKLIHESVARERSKIDIEKFEEFLNNSPETIVRNECRSHKHNMNLSHRRSRSRIRGIVNSKLRKRERKKQQTYSTRREAKMELYRKVKSESILTPSRRISGYSFKRKLLKSKAKSKTLLSLNHASTKWVPSSKAPKIIDSPKPSYTVGGTPKNYTKVFNPNKYKNKQKKEQMDRRRKRKSKINEERKRRNYAEELEYKRGPYSVHDPSHKKITRKEINSRHTEKREHKREKGSVALGGTEDILKKMKRKRHGSADPTPNKKRKLYKEEITKEEKISTKHKKRKIECDPITSLSSDTIPRKRQKLIKEESSKKSSSKRNKRKLEQNIVDSNCCLDENSESLPKKRKLNEAKYQSTAKKSMTKVDRDKRKSKSREIDQHHNEIEKKLMKTSLYRISKSKSKSMEQIRNPSKELRAAGVHSKTPTFFFPFLKKGKKEKRTKKSRNMDRKYSNAYKDSKNMNTKKQKIKKMLRRMC